MQVFRDFEPIAIVGIGCRFPGGVQDVAGFWDFMASGSDGITDVPAERWSQDLFYDPDPKTPGRMIVRQGGFLDMPVDHFDAGFFGMTPREAGPLDPQQRLLLEVAWEALEDAGMPAGSVAGGDVGTYIGGFMVDNLHLQFAEANRELISPHTSPGSSLTMLSARLAHFFDWRGPCLSIDTACSSSLVALHYACQAIANGECGVAVTGGVNLMLDPFTTMVMSKGQFLSPDARCKAFDHRANGYARGEGAGILILKPLSSAERDNDRIYAVIRGTAVNQDGKTPGITVPSEAAQRAVILAACRQAGIKPDSIDYFEAHGTGTPVGDPIEAAAVGSVLKDSSRQHWIGSVKTNIGHLEAAAGVAGVIKAALCLDRGLIPPHLHFEQPNPSIPLESYSLRIPLELVPFETGEDPRRASVNSFGYGGTNAHAVLEEAPRRKNSVPPASGGRTHLLPISARSTSALRGLADSYATLLESEDAPPLKDICVAAAERREHHPLRAFVVADNSASAAMGLRALEPEPDPVPVTPADIACVYTGMGPQWWGMGRELLSEPAFADVVATCDRFLAGFGLSIRDEFMRTEPESRLTQTLFAQLGNFVVQAGLTALWRSWGFQPKCVIGHSVGELGAAYASGVYSLEDALTIGYHRATLQSTTGRGAMLAVSCPAAQLQLPPGVCIAAVNSPTSTTLAGDPAAIEALAAQLSAADVFTTMLKVEVAYHSHHMDKIREPLLKALHDIRPKPAAIPLFSTTTGDQVGGTEMNASYWWGNVRQPVLFAEAFGHLLERAPKVILEVGPHPVLTSAIREVAAEKRSAVTVLASQHRDRPGKVALMEAVGGLYVAGATVNWNRLLPGSCAPVDLPKYPWQRERHWAESQASRLARVGTGHWKMAPKAVGGPEPSREAELSSTGFPYLADHRLGDTVVFPASGYIEAALALLDGDEPCVLEDFVFHRPLVREPQTVTTLRSVYNAELREVSVHSRVRGTSGTWTRHAVLRRAVLAGREQPAPVVTARAALTEGLAPVERDEIYARLADTGLKYGPAFRGLTRLWYRRETAEVFAELDTGTVDTAGHRLHPALLDAAFHAMRAAMLGEDSSTVALVPTSIDEVCFFQSPGATLWVHGRLRAGLGQDRVKADLTLITDEGAVVATVRGLEAGPLPVHTGSEEVDGLYYEQVWEPEVEPGPGVAEGTWTVIGNSDLATGIAEGLATRGAQVARMSLNDAVATGIEVGRGVVLVTDAAKGHDTAACGPAAQALELLRSLSGTVPLVLVTSRAQSLGSQDVVTDPFAASVWGFGRVVNAERPELRYRQIDTDVASDALIDALCEERPEETLIRDNSRYVNRQVRASAQSPLTHAAIDVGNGSVRLVTASSGRSGVGFAGHVRRAPGPGEVEIAVEHISTDFTRLKADAAGDSLRIECSGTVTRTGAGATGLKVGDPVFGLAHAPFASHAVLDQMCVVKRPATLSSAEALSMFPALVAHTSLTQLANVKPGERVLVHSAASSVGLAAIRIATWLGAEVFATAGTPERREFLRQEGVAAVTDSRSTTFADEIRASTNGEGVDVVLNFRAGEIFEKSLELLRPFGRLVELGPGALAREPATRLKGIERSVALHTLDYDQLIRLRPEIVHERMQELAGFYANNVLSALPVAEFAPSEMQSIFDAVAQHKHIGKHVVRMAGERLRVPVRSLPRPSLRADATYVVTGGLSGFGLETARRLADLGARHLLLLSRSGLSSEVAAQAVEEMRSLGVDVRVEKADVARRAELADALSRARQELPPLRGVVHSAAVFDNGLLADHTRDRFLAATRPKADGAWNLHLETESDELDFFVLYSSAASQVGSSGSGPYAAACEFLNGLARYRRGLALLATSVNWGEVGEVGIAARDETVGSALRRHGNVAVPAALLLTELETLLVTNPVEVTIAGLRWDRWAQVSPHLAALPRYSTLVPAPAAAGSGEAPISERVREATGDERTTLLSAAVTATMAQVTGLSSEQVLSGQAVSMDSLMAVELNMHLRRELGLSVSPVRLQRDLNVSVLVEALEDALVKDQAEPVLPAASPVVHQLVSSDGLTLHGHLSLPAGTGPHPAVVVCCADQAGALDADGRYARIHEHIPLVRAGFAVFTVDMRGALGHGAELAAKADLGGRDVDDVLAAAGYLAELPEIDASRMSIFGTSRGAYTALLTVARAPKLWRRAVLLMGFYDPLRYLAERQAVRSENASPFRSAPVDTDRLQTVFAEKSRQPLGQLTPDFPPLYILHGDEDRFVLPSQSKELVAQARKARIQVEAVTVPGVGHDIEYTHHAWHGLWNEITAFLDTDRD